MARSLLRTCHVVVQVGIRRVAVLTEGESSGVGGKVVTPDADECGP